MEKKGEGRAMMLGPREEAHRTCKKKIEWEDRIYIAYTMPNTREDTYNKLFCEQFEIR